MKLVITMELGNAAFEFGGTAEIRRVLNDVCDRLPESHAYLNGCQVPCVDANGNTVGTTRIE